MSDKQKSLDWDGARLRLERIGAVLERAENPESEDILAVYRKRAERYRQPRTALQQSDAGDYLVVFRLEQNRYAVHAAAVREILRNVPLTPAPGAPPSIAGLIQIRGEVRPVYDLLRQLDLPSGTTPAPPVSSVLLLHENNRDFGVRVDAIEEIRTLGEQSRKGDAQTPHVAWITEDLVSVLDNESLWGRRMGK